jgi:hypothetical protein
MPLVRVKESWMAHYKLTGCFAPLAVSSTFLVPYFVVDNSNKNFVQSVDDTYHIEGFAEYDLSEIPTESLFDVRRGGTFIVGDPAIVAVKLDQMRPIWGTREEISAILKKEIQYCELPPFFRLEVSRFLGDEIEVRRTIALASKCFSNHDHGLVWSQLEQASSANGAGMRRKSRSRWKREWFRVLDQLRAEVGDDNFRNWLQPSWQTERTRLCGCPTGR